MPGAAPAASDRTSWQQTVRADITAAVTATVTGRVTAPHPRTGTVAAPVTGSGPRYPSFPPASTPDADTRPARGAPASSDEEIGHRPRGHLTGYLPGGTPAWLRST